MARECGQGRGQPRPSSPVPVPVPVDPVPVTASEDDGDSSSVSSDHRDPPASVPFPSASDRPRKPRVKSSTASKPSPFAKPAAPVVFPVTDEYWFHVKELLDKALSNAPVFDSDRSVNSYISNFLHSNKIIETYRRPLVYDYMAVFYAKKS